MNGNARIIDLTAQQLRAMIGEVLRGALDQRSEDSDAQLLSTTELAKRTGVSCDLVRGWAANGCPHLRVGRKYRFRYSAVVAWLEGQKNG